MSEVKNQLFKATNEGYVPDCDLYDDLAKGLFRRAGNLFAYSLCQNGPAPNFFSSWIFTFIYGGLEAILDDLPERINNEAYNKVNFYTNRPMINRLDVDPLQCES